jgi:hypothetical protein
MANSTITQLPQAIGVTGAEYMEAVQAGTSVRVTALQIAQLSSVPVLVAQLPNANIGAGVRGFVSDALSVTFNSIVIGGGGNTVPVYSDATNWRIG